MSMTFPYVPVSFIEHCRCLLREEKFEHSSMREPSGRAWAVCEASPSKKEQPLTFVPRAPSRFIFFTIIHCATIKLTTSAPPHFEIAATARTSGDNGTGTHNSV